MTKVRRLTAGSAAGEADTPADGPFRLGRRGTELAAPALQEGELRGLLFCRGLGEHAYSARNAEGRVAAACAARRAAAMKSSPASGSAMRIGAAAWRRLASARFRVCSGIVTRRFSGGPRPGCGSGRRRGLEFGNLLDDLGQRLMHGFEGFLVAALGAAELSRMARRPSSSACSPARDRRTGLRRLVALERAAGCASAASPTERCVCSSDL